MKKLLLLLILLIGCCSCSSKPQNDVSFKEISLDYSNYAGKVITMQVWAVEARNYFNYAFTNTEDLYWPVRVTDGTKDVYAYFGKFSFKDRKKEIFEFDNTKITITSEIVSYRYSRNHPLKYNNSLLRVISFEKGWK